MSDDKENKKEKIQGGELGEIGPEPSEEQKKQEIVKEKEQPLSRVSGKDGMPLGFDQMDKQADVQMPRLAILQGLSKIVMDGKATVGKIANALTKEVYGDEFNFIPLFLFKTRAKFTTGKGLVCSSRNAFTCSFNNDETHEMGDDCLACSDAIWTKENQKANGPACSLVYNYPVLNAANLKQFPVSISLMRTALKPGKQLNSMLLFTGEDFFSSKIRLTTEQKKGEKGIYFLPVVAMLGKVTDEEYIIAKKWFEVLHKKTIEVDLQEEAPENVL
jgi:hypothetical protein